MDRRAKLKDDALLDKLEEGLEAKKVHFFAHEGEVRDERESLDHGTRFSYLGLAMKLKGHDISKTEVTGAGGAPLIPPQQGPDLSFLKQLTKDDLRIFLGIAPRPGVIEAQVIQDAVVEPAAGPQPKQEPDAPPPASS